MKLTLLLTLLGCAFLFLAIWAATITLPFKTLAGNFPKDVQKRLEPRINNLPMSANRFWGGLLTVFLLLCWLGVFVYGGFDGMRNNYGFWQYFIRFIIIAYGVKAFDIICLDYVLLTKTRFFQHYLSETEGCEGWKQFGYNRKQQLRQIIFMPFFCLALAWLFSSL